MEPVKTERTFFGGLDLLFELLFAALPGVVVGAHQGFGGPRGRLGLLHGGLALSLQRGAGGDQRHETLDHAEMFGTRTI